MVETPFHLESSEVEAALPNVDKCVSSDNGLTYDIKKVAALFL